MLRVWKVGFMKKVSEEFTSLFNQFFLDDFALLAMNIPQWVFGVYSYTYAMLMSNAII
jgi:hypothetical protein